MTKDFDLPSYEELRAIELKARELRAEVMAQAVTNLKNWFNGLIPTAVVHEPS